MTRCAVCGSHSVYRIHKGFIECHACGDVFLSEKAHKDKNMKIVRDKKGNIGILLVLSEACVLKALCNRNLSVPHYLEKEGTLARYTRKDFENVMNSVANSLEEVLTAEEVKYIFNNVETRGVHGEELEDERDVPPF